MNPLLALIVVGIIFLALSKLIGKIVQALIGTGAVLVILYAAARYFNWI